MRKCLNSDEKGLTLVEVLAALVILGILFIGIMTIFPQMTLFNEKTETKLDTMNLARQEMAAIVTPAPSVKWVGERESLDPTKYKSFEMKIPEIMTTFPVDVDLESYREETPISAGTDFVRYKRNDDYQYEADIYLECEPFLTAGLGDEVPCANPDLPQLYRVHLKVFKNNQLSSETYAYIKFTVEKLGG